MMKTYFYMALAWMVFCSGVSAQDQEVKEQASTITFGGKIYTMGKKTKHKGMGMIACEYYLKGESPDQWSQKITSTIQLKKKHLPADAVRAILEVQQRRGLNPIKVANLPEGVAGFHMAENKSDGYVRYCMGYMLSKDGTYLLSRSLSMRAPGGKEKPLRIMKNEQLDAFLAELMQCDFPAIKYDLPKANQGG